MHLITTILSHTCIVCQSHDYPRTYFFVPPNVLIDAHFYVLHQSELTHYFSLYLHTHILILPYNNMLFILLFVNIDQYSTAQPPPQDTICMQSTLPKLTQISMPTCTHSFHTYLTPLLSIYQFTTFSQQVLLSYHSVLSTGVQSACIHILAAPTDPHSHSIPPQLTFLFLFLFMPQSSLFQAIYLPLSASIGCHSSPESTEIIIEPG